MKGGENVGEVPPSYESITDGTSTTILLGEMRYAASLLHCVSIYDDSSTRLRSGTTLSSRFAPNTYRSETNNDFSFGSDHQSNSFHVSMADGSTRPLRGDIALTVLQALTTAHGREQIPELD